MATTFKTLTANDIVNTRTLLHEAIPLTGTILLWHLSAILILKHFHMECFKSVYDYPFLSSSANHIIDIYCKAMLPTHPAILEPRQWDILQHAKKINVYNQLASSSCWARCRQAVFSNFDQDGNIADGGQKA